MEGPPGKGGQAGRAAMEHCTMLGFDPAPCERGFQGGGRRFRVGGAPWTLVLHRRQRPDGQRRMFIRGAGRLDRRRFAGHDGYRRLPLSLAKAEIGAGSFLDPALFLWNAVPRGLLQPQRKPQSSCRSPLAGDRPQRLRVRSRTAQRCGDYRRFRRYGPQRLV